MSETKKSKSERLPPPQDLTTVLREWREGSGSAFGSLLDQVYDELKVIAAKRLNQSGGAVTMSATELLHEALVGILPNKPEFKNRAHFFATMSLAIRSILVDHARARAANKRGGDMMRVTLTGIDVAETTDLENLIVIDEALKALEAVDPRCAQVIHLTYFGGLSQSEIADHLNISIPTVMRDARFARNWLAKALADDA
jgi:RNA polymerase sigma factor (TIGR02999 family)